MTRLTDLLVKSAIAWPADHEQTSRRQAYHPRLRLDGHGVVRSVEISTDGGRAWTPAQVEAPPKAFSWVRGTIAWDGRAGRSRADEPRNR